MKRSRTWIDTHLSHRERSRLVDWLMERSAHPTGELILSGLQELFPHVEDYPSIASCLAWRGKQWAFELHRREIAEDSAAARILADAGNGAHLDEANRVLLQSMIFEQLRAIKEGRIEEVQPETLDALARNVSVLARQGMAERELAAKLDKLEREKRAQEAQAKTVEKDTTLTPEAKAARYKEIFGIG